MIKWRMLVGATSVVTLAASATVALAAGTSRSVDAAETTKVRELNLELVGQVQNSAPGVSPATSIQYGYISQLRALPIFRGEPRSESTALLTFYTDTTTTQVLNNGPVRVINREGKLTIYSDPAANGSFANPDSFRDGTRVLVASLRQQVIGDTTTGSFTAQNLNTITSTSPFQGPSGMLQLGAAGQRFRTVIFGRLNSPGPPSAFMAGYTYSVGAPKSDDTRKASARKR